MPLHVSSTVVRITRRSKFYYTASGIVTPVGGRPVHGLREDSSGGKTLESAHKLCTGRAPTGVTIPDAV